MKNKYLFIALLLLAVSLLEAKKISKSRSSSSSRGSSRRTGNNPQSAPTSFSNPQPSAPKPSLFGWQEKPAQRSQSQTPQRKSTNAQTHSYPSSQTGLSGNNQPKQPPSYQESVQKSSGSHSYPSQNSGAASGTQQHTNNQPAHSYPSSGGLSGNGASGAGYPRQQGGLSGTGTGSAVGAGASAAGQSHSYPSHGTGTAVGGQSHPNPGYGTGGGYPHNNNGNVNNHGGNYYHPPPPPPYSNVGPSYGSHGNYNPGYASQMPGYFGNQGGYGKGFGGVSRTSSALTGVGIAGAGVGTILTGLALWNLARSTGHRQHTVIYDNRGQPVAVEPDSKTSSSIDSMLADLVNCTLTISSENATEVLAIPCAIATSFSPEADVKDVNGNNNITDNTKCTVTVVKNTGKEYMTTIPCSTLLKSAADNNVTEPSIPVERTDTVNAPEIVNKTDVVNGPLIDSRIPFQTTLMPPLKLFEDSNLNINKTIDCSMNFGDQQPNNTCAPTSNLTVLPLHPTEAPMM